MTVTWTHPATVALIGVCIAAPHPARPTVLRAAHQLADRLATDPVRAGVAFIGDWRAARVGPIVAFYRLDPTGGAVVCHVAAVVGAGAEGRL